MSKQTEALKLALEHAKRDERHMTNAETKYWCRMYRDIAENAIKALAEQPAQQQEPVKLWLWKNFVNGRPEYWAFDNPFPCLTVNGDPLTFGEPCGWAIFKPSVNGRPDRLEQEVINTVTRLAAKSPPASKPLTDEQIERIYDRYGGNMMNCARAIERAHGIKGDA